MAYFEPTPEGVVFRVRVQPRSSKRGMSRGGDNCLKIHVNEPPAEGAANRACCEYLAKVFGIAKGRVEILSGAKSREKRILLRGTDQDFVLSRLSDKII